MELIIAMVIIGILTAIALPNYTAYVQRSNRSEARSALLEGSVWMEKWRTERGTYGNALATPTVPPATFPFTQVPATGTAKYTIAPPTIAAGGIGYTITATATGVMAGDPCTTLTIDQTGLRGRTGSGTLDFCWGR